MVNFDHPTALFGANFKDDNWVTYIHVVKITFIVKRVIEIEIVSAAYLSEKSTGEVL